MPDDNILAYPNPDGRFDELFEAPGCPRPHWSKLYGALARSTAGDIGTMRAAAERQLRDSGVSYNVYSDPQGHDRPWDLDVLPLIVDADEWQRIESGIVQRADLFNRILADLYGEQRLLREKVIPAPLIYSHSGFLRPMHGAAVPGDIYLHVYAADLARSPDGNWWVMADRTQAPSGAGYALENRLVVSRTFPALFRDLHVQHHAHFFASLRDSLMYFAPKGDGPTLAVLLTPGPYNETYFEHAFLSRYLGFPLIEGGDLTVRSNRVWLKTIGGLKRVHAILRRQDDTYCDPLELRSDSALGVAGLTDCARRGTVLIANALGSGVLESGALLGFLPRLCEHLTGERLQLPSIATWWCGERAALHDALEHAPRLVFKPADPSNWFEAIFGHDLDQQGLADLRAKLEATPESFVAQELVRVSQAPVLARSEDFRIEPRCIGLRVFAVATPNGYHVMPGGLTRVARSADVRVVSMQRGGGSKDTWVMSQAPVDTSFSLLRATVTPKELVRNPSGVPSRLAENLFWFGRYEERCDDAARLLRLALQQQLQENEDIENAQVPIYALAREFGLIGEDDEGEEDEEAALLVAATLETAPFGLPANLRSLEQAAFNLRERMSQDNWRTINALIQGMPGRALEVSEILGWLDSAITRIMTLSGYVLDGMTRDDAWRFLSIGRRIERLAFQCLALQVAFRHKTSGLTWLLRLADSIVTYRARYMASPEWLPVLDLLVLDGNNPRSVMFQASGVLHYLDKLEAEYGPCGAGLFRGSVEFLETIQPARDLHPGSEALRDTIDTLRSAAFSLNDQLTLRFFTHGETRLWAALKW